MSAEEKEDFAVAQYQREKLKRRTLGNIRFVGELFKQGLLTEQNMHDAISQLLRNHSDPEEEETESLCQLLATVGRQIDQPKAKAYMDAYFVQLGKLAQDTRLSSRIRFMVQDIIDMRRNGWQSRQQPTGPRLLSDIREEAKRKEQEQEAERQRQAASRGSSRQGSNSAGRIPSMAEQMGRSSRGGGLPTTTDGWTLQQRGGSVKPEKIDHSKFGSVSSALKRDTDVSTVRLGPGTGMGTGARGWQMVQKRDESGTAMARTASSSSTSSVTASGGVTTASRSSAAGVDSTANMFGLLANEDNSGHKSADEGSLSHAEVVASAGSPTDKSAAPSEGKPPLLGTATVAAESPRKLSKAIATRKIDAMVEEFYSNFNSVEAGQDFKDLGTDEYHSQAISAILEKVTEKKRNDHVKTADLFVYLVENEIIQTELINAWYALRGLE